MLVSAIHQHESATGMSPPSRTPLPSPTLTSPLSVVTEHWVELLVSHNKFPFAILHMVICMFPCYSLSSSHPLLPALCPQVCFLCLHLHCYPANGFISTVLDSIYMYQYINIYINIYMCQYFSFSPLCIMDCSFIHLIRTDSNVFFYGWVLFHCIYVPQLLYPFICWWTPRLLPRPSYCKSAVTNIGYV